jgi:hypothetical protein
MTNTLKEVILIQGMKRKKLLVKLKYSWKLVSLIILIIKLDKYNEKKIKTQLARFKELLVGDHCILNYSCDYLQCMIKNERFNLSTILVQDINEN